MEVIVGLLAILTVLNLLTRPQGQPKPPKPQPAPQPNPAPKLTLVVEGAAQPQKATPQPDPEPTAPVPAKPPVGRPATRREQVWAVLDTAPDGASYNALIDLVRKETGTGTSKATILAWRKNRAEQSQIKEAQIA